MKCIYCEKEFKLLPMGIQGGANRLLCYDCLPEGVEQNIKSTRVRDLLVRKAREEKEKIGCQICGYNKNGAALEWHHTNPEEKDFNPSEICRHMSYEDWQLYQQEIKKCILLCANCHREIHNPILPLEPLTGNNNYEKLRQEVRDFYLNTKSLSKTKQHFKIGEKAIKNILNYYNIKIISAFDTSAKAVCQYDKKTGDYINKFNSATEASRQILGNESGNGHILEACNGKRKSAYGYKWQFENSKNKS